MKFRCASCGSSKPKTEDGKFIGMDTGEWDNSFYLFCSEKCKNRAIKLAENLAKANGGK